MILPLIFAWLLSVPAMAQNGALDVKNVYGFGDGDESFVLWVSPALQNSNQTLLKFSQSEEIWIVSTDLGARGDVLYRNDTGRIVLRENLIGGATLYPYPKSKGVPAWQKGLDMDIAPLPDMPAVPAKEYKTVEEWSRAYAYAGTQKPTISKTPDANLPGTSDQRIEFEDWPMSNAAYKMDVATHLTTVLQNQSNEEINKVIVKLGDQPDLLRENSQLTIWVNPELGYAGRPSSEKILQNLKLRRG